MRQLNLIVTPEFERDLKKLIKARKYPNQSAAIRAAVHDAVQQKAPEKSRDWHSLLGAALRYPANPKPRFKTEDDLWS